jgi:hypothetical protein
MCMLCSVLHLLRLRQPHKTAQCCAMLWCALVLHSASCQAMPCQPTHCVRPCPAQSLAVDTALTCGSAAPYIMMRLDALCAAPLTQCAVPCCTALRCAMPCSAARGRLALLHLCVHVQGIWHITAPATAAAAGDGSVSCLKFCNS